MYTLKKRKILNEKEIICSFDLIVFFSFIEMLRNVQIYQEYDVDSFDAINIDLQRDQIIIGAK